MNLISLLWMSILSILSILVLTLQNYRRLSYYFLLIMSLLSALSVALIWNKGIFWYEDLTVLYHLSSMNVNYIWAWDGISLYMVLLSSFLLSLCLLNYWFIRYKLSLYALLLWLSAFLLWNVFLSLDLYIFYIAFEGILIPMVLLIGTWGSRSRKIYAAYQLLIYTLVGSVLVLVCLLSIWSHKGGSSWECLAGSTHLKERQIWIALLLILGLGVKIPVIPVHIWLPEAHVEAPTPGSVILAALVLKLGSYAWLKLLLPSSWEVWQEAWFLILLWAFLGLLFPSLVALSQIDMKKIIAYSSVAHMNFSLMGLFALNWSGLVGSFYMMLGHALTSGALFFGLGVLYDRYKTRLLFYYGGLILTMPLFSIIYFFFVLSNFAFPGSVNFAAEFLILLGAFELSNVMLFFSSLALILTLIYSLMFYNRIFMGFLPLSFIRFYSDLIRIEAWVLMPLWILVLIGGLKPSFFISFSISSLFKIHLHIL